MHHSFRSQNSTTEALNPAPRHSHRHPAMDKFSKYFKTAQAFVGNNVNYDKIGNFARTSAEDGEETGAGVPPPPADTRPPPVNPAAREPVSRPSETPPKGARDFKGYTPPAPTSTRQMPVHSHSVQTHVEYLILSSPFLGFLQFLSTARLVLLFYSVSDSVSRPAARWLLHLASHSFIPWFIHSLIS